VIWRELAFFECLASSRNYAELHPVTGIRFIAGCV